MAQKTVIRNMLSKWGILSIEMQKAYSEDINTDKTINEIISTQLNSNTVFIEEWK